MLRYLFILLLLGHGLLHLTGFTRAFGWAAPPSAAVISRTVGTLWLTAAFLLAVVAWQLFQKNESWWVAGLAALVLSQCLLFSLWREARFGTIVNAVLLLAIVIGFANWSFHRTYTRAVRQAEADLGAGTSALVTEADLERLPPPVRRYLRYAGVPGKPRVREVFVRLTGTMRQRGRGWFPFGSVQHNFVALPTRLFYMKAKMFGTEVPGFHAYENGRAEMQVRLLGMIPMVAVSGGALDRAETVTYFNDLCIFAPAALAEPFITWGRHTDTSAVAQCTVNGQTISAELFFNAEGALVNFVSDDRYEVSAKRCYRFSTPLGRYRDFSGMRLASYGEALWQYPEGTFVYGRFFIEEVLYNEAATLAAGRP